MLTPPPALRNGSAAGGPSLVWRAGLEERLQPVRPAGVAQFAQRLGFDLADAFARDGELLADFFERVLAAVLQAEAHLDDLLFARAQAS